MESINRLNNCRKHKSPSSALIEFTAPDSSGWVHYLVGGWNYYTMKYQLILYKKRYKEVPKL